MTLKTHGMDIHWIFPGYAWNDWTTPAADFVLDEMPSYGVTGVDLQQQWYMTTQTTNRVTTGIHTVNAASLRHAAAKIVANGQMLGYKPHVGITGATMPQANLAGGGYYTNGASVSSGSNLWTIPDAVLDASWNGSRAGNPNPFHYNDANYSMGMDTYGTTNPTFRTITVVDATHFTISGAPATTSYGAASLMLASPTKFAQLLIDYRALIDADMAVLQENGRVVEYIDCNTEHNFMSVMYPDQWRTFVTALQTSYPNAWVTAGTAGSSDKSASCTYYDATRDIAFTLYPSIQVSGSSQDTRTQMEAVMDGHITQMEAIQSAWAAKGYQRKIRLSEFGACSIDNAGFNPLQGGIRPYSEETQSMFVDVVLSKLLPRTDLISGLHWWTSAHANTTLGGIETGNTGYAIAHKKAGLTFARKFGKAKANYIHSGGQRLRIH